MACRHFGIVKRNEYFNVQPLIDEVGPRNYLRTRVEHFTMCQYCVVLEFLSKVYNDLRGIVIEMGINNKIVV